MKITIARGDTLSQLVSNYNKQNGTRLTVAEVARANQLKSPDLIIAGKTLVFPDAFEQPQKPQRPQQPTSDQFVTAAHAPGTQQPQVATAADQPGKTTKQGATTTRPQARTWEPLPREFRNATSSLRNQEALLERFGHKGFEQNVRWLQQLVGVPVTGKLDAATVDRLEDSTLRELNRLKTAPPVVQKPMSRTEMTKLQDALHRAGTRSPGDVMKGEVLELQRQLNAKGFRLVLDGNIRLDDPDAARKTKTYQAMVDSWGQKQANEVLSYLSEQQHSAMDNGW